MSAVAWRWRSRRRRSDGQLAEPSPWVYQDEEPHFEADPDGEVEVEKLVVTPRRPLRTLCVQCGPNVAIDEEGCCASCGADAVGPWLARLVVIGEGQALSPEELGSAPEGGGDVREVAERPPVVVRRKPYTDPEGHRRWQYTDGQRDDLHHWEPLVRLVEHALARHRLTYQEIEGFPGDGLPLVDALSIGDDISTGREELELLADAVAGDLDEWCRELRSQLARALGELAGLRGLLSEALDLLKRWGAEEDCECPPEGHTCGKPYYDQLLTAMERALSASPLAERAGEVLEAAVDLRSRFAEMSRVDPNLRLLDSETARLIRAVDALQSEPKAQPPREGHQGEEP